MDMIDKILLQHGIRPNLNRIRILREIFETEKAYSLCTLSQVVNDQMDRTTVYRILNLFNERKLLQKVPCTEGNMLFALNHQVADKPTHANFRCKSCQKVENLPDLPEEYLNRLSQFKINLESVAFEGFCEDCSQSH